MVAKSTWQIYLICPLITPKAKTSQYNPCGAERDVKVRTVPSSRPLSPPLSCYVRWAVISWTTSPVLGRVDSFGDRSSLRINECFYLRGLTCRDFSWMQAWRERLWAPGERGPSLVLTTRAERAGWNEQGFWCIIYLLSISRADFSGMLWYSYWPQWKETQCRAQQTVLTHLPWIDWVKFDVPASVRYGTGCIWRTVFHMSVCREWKNYLSKFYFAP